MNPFGLASCLSLALSLTAQIDHHHGPATSLTDEVITDCEKLIKAAMKQRGIPGLTVAVGMGGRIVWTRGFGLSVGLGILARTFTTDHVSDRIVLAEREHDWNREGSAHNGAEEEHSEAGSLSSHNQTTIPQAAPSTPTPGAYAR